MISVHVKAFESLISTDEDFLAECTEKRDRMFNDIFLYSNFAFNIGCLIVGVLMDRLVHKKNYTVNVPDEVRAQLEFPVHRTVRV